MPSQPKDEKPRPKRPSSGLTKKMEGIAIAAMEKKFKDEAAANETKKVTGGRAIVGYTFLGISALFMVAEFFGFVPHVNTVGHWILQGAPLIIGLHLVAPDVLDRGKELVMWGVSQFARIRNLKITLPDESEKEDES